MSIPYVPYQIPQRNATVAQPPQGDVEDVTPSSVQPLSQVDTLNDNPISANNPTVGQPS